jgi:hypothetical protein
MATINLKRFDMTKMSSTSFSVCVGKKQTGKSTLVKDILYHHPNITRGFVASSTEDLVPFYSLMSPTPQLETGHHDSEGKLRWLCNFLNSQQEENKSNNTLTINPSYVVIEDYAKEYLDHYVTKINSKLNTLLIMTAQHPTELTELVYSNADYIFLFPSFMLSYNDELFRKCSLSVQPNIFKEILNCLDGYQCLVIDNTVKSNKFEERVFWYQSQLH